LIADEPRGAGAIVDHELLAERIRKMRAEQSPDRISAASGRRRNDDAHRLRRPFGLRVRERKRCAQRGEREACLEHVNFSSERFQ
jgi:hypothetical protein